MTEPTDPFDAAHKIAAALDERGISYAIGGAVALALWAIPRGTADVDVNVFVPAEGIEPVLDALVTLGAEVDRGRALFRARTEGLFVARLGPWRIDVFPRSIEFHDEAERTRRRHTIDGCPAWYLSAEALAVFKLLLFRGKDVADLERLVAVQGTGLDCAYVRRHIVAMMGESDDRTRTWDRIVARFRP